MIIFVIVGFIAQVIDGVLGMAYGVISTSFLLSIGVRARACVAVGLVSGFVEELGWTGFAIPRLRLRYGVLATGLIVGVLWGVWHLLQMMWVGSTSAITLPLALFLPLYFLSAIAALTAYRVLMVWVYDRTKSLLVVILMHASYIFSTLFVLAPPTTGVPFLTYSWIFAATLWVVVAAITVVNRGQLSGQPCNKGGQFDDH